MRLLAIGVTQDFGAAGALRGAQLALAEGELHALVGGCGAGKAALLAVLGGRRRLARGLMLLDGQPYAPASPEAARRAGVWSAGRGETLADGLTVEENLVLGMEPARRGWIDRRARRSLAARALAELPVSGIPPSAPAGSLSPGDRRRVEIARAFLVLPKVLLMEEAGMSGSALSAADFGLLRRLAARGVSILCATRSPEAARAYCSRYTLLCRGGTAAFGRTRGLDAAALAGPPALPRLSRHRGKTLALARDGLAVHAGEIFGLACAGPPPSLRGVGGRTRAAAGGIFPGLSLADNLTLPYLRRFGTFGFISPERQRTVAADWISKLGIRAPAPGRAAAQLSAADRVKLAVGRQLLGHAPVVAVESPTRGLDASGRAEIHALLQTAAAQGRGVIVTSFEPAELLALCDTVALVRPGRAADCRPVEEWSEPALSAALFGSP